MDPNISKHLMTSPLKANDLAGLTPEQIMSVTQSGAQQRGQVASMLDAVEGRKLQRKQQEQMERQYKHQREMSEKQFELLQRQDVRQHFNEMFSMGLQMGQRKIEQRKLQLNEQLQNAQLQNNSIERKKLGLELGQLQKKQEMLNGVEGDIQIGPNTSVPKLLAMQNPELFKIGTEYDLKLWELEHGTEDLPTAEKSIRYNADRISWHAQQNYGIDIQPEVAQSDAALMDYHSKIADSTAAIKISGDNVALLSKLFDDESRDKLVDSMIKQSQKKVLDIQQGRGPNVMAELARRDVRLPAMQGLEPANAENLTEEDRFLVDAALKSVRDGQRTPEQAMQVLQEAFKNGEVSENVVRSFEGAFRNAVEDIQNPETETETGVETDVPDSDVNVENKTSASEEPKTTEPKTTKPKKKNKEKDKSNPYAETGGALLFKNLMNLPETVQSELRERMLK